VAPIGLAVGVVCIAGICKYDIITQINAAVAESGNAQICESCNSDCENTAMQSNTVKAKNNAIISQIYPKEQIQNNVGLALKKGELAATEQRCYGYHVQRYTG
jgi:hypothetical protein